MTILKPSPVDFDALLAFHAAHFGDARMEADDDGGNDDGGRGEQDRGTDGQDNDRDQRHDDDDDERDGLRGGGKRAIEAERRAAREARQKAREEKARADELAEKVAEHERSKMDAQSRAEAERDDWQKKYEVQAAELAARELDILRRDVAAEKGLSIRQARYLTGDSREALEANADELIADFAVNEEPPAGPKNPKPDPAAGKSGGGQPQTVSQARDAYIARMRQQAGAAPINTNP